MNRPGSGPPPEVVTRIVVVSYILAIALPPLGFGLGVVLTFAPRLKSKHGLWIVLLSIAGAVIWALLIKGGALTATNQSY